ncbi:hypothetical protein ACGFNU_48965 [Spirillospora sp. NPDC048911]|uniref:hypothetical protein n=1 Tax=Spirillospora sp. NPDC048911 TaxID=3364527 RepID=UPI0037216EB9
MGDPFLRASGDEASDGIHTVTDDDLRQRSGLPQEIFDIVPRDHVEAFVSRVESWADLDAALDGALVSAGFHRHEQRGGGTGGFNIATWLRDDGVILSWALAGRMHSGSDPFDDTVESVMHPALAAILQDCGFDVEIIPHDQDDAGCLLVTGLTAPSKPA